MGEIHSNMSEEIFFNELLRETKEQFEKSPVFEKQIRENKLWNYAVCATPIIKNQGVVFGINWGGEGRAQTEMPSGKGITEYHFIKHTREFLEKYWKLDFEQINFNYTNLCFFRTAKEKDLVEKDYELSLPLFEKYVRYINPPWLLSIGGKNMKVLDKHNKLEHIDRHFDNENKFKGHSAKLWGYDVFSVPHPSAEGITKESRHIIWEKVTESKNKLL